jgi:microcystin-dependent protein
MLIALAGPVAPRGWLLCNGTAFNASLPLYAALYASIGTTWGGSLIGAHVFFNVPNLRGRVLIGTGQAAAAAGATVRSLGSSGGEETHKLISAETPVTAISFTNWLGGPMWIPVVGGGNPNPSGVNIASAAGYNGGFLAANTNGGDLPHNNNRSQPPTMTSR